MSPCLKVEALGIDVRDESVLSDFDAETGDELFGFGGKIVGISSENARAALEQNDARFFRTNAAEIVAEGFAAISAIAPASSSPVAPAPTITKVSQARASSSVAAALGTFERVEQFVADGSGFLNSFEAGGVVAPLDPCRSRRFGTGGDDKRVVGENGAIAKGDGFRDGIEIIGLAEKDFGVFLAAKDSTKGSGNLSGRERAGGDLVEKRLEEMEVALVDECDFGVSAFEGLRGDQAAEAAAKNKDAMLPGHVSPSVAQEQSRYCARRQGAPLFR